MAQTYINKSHITKVIVRNQVLEDFYTWKCEKRFLGIKIRSAAFNSRWGGYIGPKSIGDMKELGYIIEQDSTSKDYHAYHKPCVIICYLDNSSRKWEFDYMSEAKEFSQNVVKNANLVLEDI